MKELYRHLGKLISVQASRNYAEFYRKNKIEGKLVIKVTIISLSRYIQKKGRS